MIDPLSLIVTAVALGAAAGLKPTVEQAVKDAYTGAGRNEYGTKGGWT
jgi:hypothetical protein